jgi:16S rRNA processing protein RimM
MPATKSSQALLIVGKVIGVYGVRGFLKIRSFTETPNQILRYAPWYLQLLEQEQCFSIEDQQWRPPQLLVKLKGLDSPEQSRCWLQADIAVPETCLPPLPSGEFYWWQLLQMQVINEEGITLGTVLEIIENPAHPLLLLKDTAGKTRLLPWVREKIIKEIDFENKTLKVAWQADWND